MKSKPSNLKYTDLCIYIDKTIYNRDENNNPISLREMTPLEESTVYNYLYNLISALTVKQRLLKNLQDVEEFSIGFANDLFLRLINKRQSFSNPEMKREKGKLKPIKSVLNYVKNVLPLIVVDFRKRNFKETFSTEYLDENDVEGVKNFLEGQVRAEYEKPRQKLFEDYFADIIKYLDDILDKSIFKKNEFEKNNLKISILLTLNRMLSLPVSCNNLKDSKKINLIKSQIENWKDNIVIWNKDKGITKTLVILNIQRLFRLIISDINKEESENALPEDTVKDILETALPTYGLNQAEED